MKLIIIIYQGELMRTDLTGLRLLLMIMHNAIHRVEGVKHVTTGQEKWQIMTQINESDFGKCQENGTRLIALCQLYNLVKES